MPSNEKSSNIEFISIDVDYPKAGEDNDSQGFRDNFRHIQKGLETAKDEVSELQRYSVQKGADDNDMQNGTLSNVTLDTYTQKALGESGGTKLTSTAQNPVDISEGHYQSYVVGDDCSLAFTNWPSKNYASVIVELTADENGPYTVTFASDSGGGIKKEPSLIWDEALADTGEFQTNSVKAFIGQTEVPTGPDGNPDIIRHVFHFWTYNGGGTVYAKYLGGYDITSEAPVGSGGSGDGTTVEIDTTLDVNTYTGTSYTLTEDDGGDFIRMDNDLSNSVIVPTNSAVSFPKGTIVLVRQIGGGSTTIIPSIGVTINAPLDEYSIAETDYGVALVKVANNEWDMIKAFGGVAQGDLAAFSQEFEARLQDLYVEILSADPTFVVRFDAIQDNINNAVVQLQNDFNALEAGLTQSVTDVTAQADNATAYVDSIKPTFSNIQDEFTTIKNEWTAFDSDVTQLTNTIESLNIEGGFENGLGANGYQRLPGGCIMQWGTTTVSAQFSKAISWPMKFPNAALNAQATIVDTATADYTRTDVGATIGSLTTIGAVIVNYVSPESGPSKEIYWFAIGY